MAVTKTRISITIEPKLVRRLDRLAKSSKLSRSELIEQLCRDGMEDQEMMVKAFTNPVLVEAFGKAFANRDVLRAMTSTMGDELEDDQLELFTATMEKLVQGAAAGTL